jgi:hypothetical protein
LRASEFEARAAASLNRLAATVQEGRSGRSQALGKTSGVCRELMQRPATAPTEMALYVLRPRLKLES